MRRRKTIAIGAGASLAATLGLTAAAHAATYEVDNLNDPSGAGACTAMNDGDCSLRQAMENARLNAGDDNVTFKSGLSGQISLGSKIKVDPAVKTDRVSVTGPGANALTVTAGSGNHHFEIYSPVSLQGMTLSGASDSFGGAVRAVSATADVSLSGMAITSSHSKYGAGVTASDHATLTITGSTISGNSADDTGLGEHGGGVSLGNGVDARISNSTITGNSAASGGGISIDSSDPGHLVITDSTISGNTAAAQPDPDPADPPYGGFGGGIEVVGAGADVKLYNSIVANNIVTPVSGAPSHPDIDGAVTSRFSLIEDPAGAAITTPAGSLTLTGVDPQLGPLQNNGGPTSTLKPAATSPAIDQGGSALTTDQRGLPRPVAIAAVKDPAVAGANGADMGAVELTAAEGPVAVPAAKCAKKKKKHKHKGKGKKKALAGEATAAKKKKHHKKKSKKCGKKKHKKRRGKKHKH